MAKTLVKEDLKMATDQPEPGYSISQLSEHFLRSPSWVKQRKNDLKEIWYWCQEDLFETSGSLTQTGFERLQDLFDKTANSAISTTLQGKRTSKAVKPQMSPGEYREYIWAKHRKLPPGIDFPLDTGYATGYVADQGSDQEIEVIEAELDPTDTASEIAENTAIALYQVGKVNQHNRQTFNGGLGKLKGALKQRIKQELAPAFQEAMGELYAEMSDEIGLEIPPPTTPTVKRTTRKSQ